MTTPAPAISIIIPTRDRAESLRVTLEALRKQIAGRRAACEVVVVDNGSTDHTRAAVEALDGSFGVPLRYVCEPVPGRPAALNAGMQAAAGEVFVFTDDDVLPEPGWLNALWESLMQEQADGVAGRIVPEWRPSRPSWIGDEVAQDLNRTGLGLLDHGLVRLRSWEGRDCRWVGGNMAIRRAAMLRIGPFDPHLVRGQDFEYYERAVAQGLRIVYEPSAVVRHIIGADRATPDYLRAWRHRQGRYAAQRIPWKATHLVTIMPLWRWAETVRIIGRWAESVVMRRSWWQRFYAELTLREELSTWAERLRQWPDAWARALTGRLRASGAD